GPLWEPEFSESSYGFHPGRNAHQAVEAARSYVAEARRRTRSVGRVPWLAPAQTAYAALATLEAPTYSQTASDPGGTGCQPATPVGHLWSWSLLEWWCCSHARGLSPVLVRPHGFALAAGHSAASLVGFMNRPWGNRTTGGVGGRRE